MPKTPEGVVGRTITRVRLMTKAEVEKEGWTIGRYDDPIVIELDDGAVLYASQDDEGNGPGVMFGTSKTGTPFRLLVPKAAA